MFFENWSDSIKENIRLLNDSLKGIDFRDKDFKTYIQIVAPIRISDEVKEFRNLLNNAIPNIRELDATIDGRKNHFYNNIEPLISKLDKEEWRKRVMEVRSWFSYKAEEFYKETNTKFKTYENMGQLSGGEKSVLEKTNNRVQALQKQLQDVEATLTRLSEVEINNKNREIFEIQSEIKKIEDELKENKLIVEPFGQINAEEFEKRFPEIINVEYNSLKTRHREFQTELLNGITEREKVKRGQEDIVKLKINMNIRNSASSQIIY